MRLPFLSLLRRASRNRAFVRDNPDIQRIFGARGSTSKRRSKAPAALSPAEIAHWNDYGFLILKGFFDPSTIERYKHHVDDLWQARVSPDNPLVIYSNRGPHYFRDALDEDRSQTYRLLDHHLHDALTRDFSMNPMLTEILHQLMGHPPVVCNTILFEWGSEQDLHSDMFYMPPKSENQMLATWLAIDDVTEDNGPLLYVPGSHKLPPHRFSHGKVDAITDEVPSAVAAIQERMSELGLATERFFAKRGDLLIWHSRLVHGGDTIRNQAARRTSLVTHYYSTCDVPNGRWQCAERTDGSLLLMKEHVRVG